MLFCNSNHVLRAAKRLEEAGVPGDFLRPIGEVLQAPRGWKWADSWTVDNVSFEHGDGYSGLNTALKIAIDNRMPSVIGHVHTQAGVQYQRTGRSVLWGMNAGCLIDPASPAFAYGKTFRLKPVIGTGVVIDGVPQWIPLT